MTERFLVNEPKQEFAAKTSHDRSDIIELPEFVNIPSDQGTVQSAEEALELSGTEPPQMSAADVMTLDDKNMMIAKPQNRKYIWFESLTK